MKYETVALAATMSTVKRVNIILFLILRFYEYPKFCHRMSEGSGALFTEMFFPKIVNCDFGARKGK